MKLLNSKVCIVGLGGLGSPSTIQLASMGVGSIRLVDRDVVELSNLHRQPLYNRKWLGYPKVEAAAAQIKKINPQVKTELFPTSLNEENAEEIIKNADVVIDGLDHIEPRYILNRASNKLDIPYIFGGAIETFGNLTTILPGKTACLECFMADLTDKELPTCGVVGVHPSILGIVSSIQVSEAIKIILGKEPSLANKLLFCDLRKLSFEEVYISRRINCQTCGDERFIKPIKSRKLVESVCGRGGRPAYVITPKENLRLDMEKLYNVLKERSYNVKIRTHLGITFNINDKTSFSILKSGIAIIEGISKESKALGIFKEIIVKDLDISWSKVN